MFKRGHVTWVCDIIIDFSIIMSQHYILDRPSSRCQSNVRDSMKACMDTDKKHKTMYVSKQVNITVIDNGDHLFVTFQCSASD